MELSSRTVHVSLPHQQPVNIGFTDVTLTVTTGAFKKVKKEVLKGLSGKFKSGELTAIMGPSGAGKSSLLNILTGFHMTGVGGKLWRNEASGPLERASPERKRINWTRLYSRGTLQGTDEHSTWRESCYIMQDDHLNPFFTLIETMTYAAELKIGSALDKKTKKLLVGEILETLGLVRCKYTRCSNLSGGQKKRLSIALELIDNPPVMFLDEPTTGLDSSASLQLVNLLVKLARGGRTIVCSIHQPSAAMFDMFDHVYFIGAGRCLYTGHPGNVVSFLQSIGLNCPNYHNPADFLVDVVTGEYGDFTDDLIRAAKDPTWRVPRQKQIRALKPAGDSLAANGKIKACVLVGHQSEWAKIPVLVRRCGLQLHRDWGSTYLKLGLHIFVSLILGLTYAEAGNDAGKAFSNLSYFLITMVYLCFTTLIPASTKMPEEVKVLKKEYFNNWYKFRTFFIAFHLVNIPVQIFFCWAHVTLSYYLSSQLLEWSRYLMFILVNQLLSGVSLMLGLSFGVISNPVNGVFVSSVLLAVMVLFTGYLVILPHMPRAMYYVSYASYLRYGFEGLSLSQYGFGRRPLDCHQLYCHLKRPEKILDEIGFKGGQYWNNVWFLVGFFALFTIYSYVLLNRKMNSRT